MHMKCSMYWHRLLMRRPWLIQESFPCLRYGILIVILFLLKKITNVPYLINFLWGWSYGDLTDLIMHHTFLYFQNPDVGFIKNEQAVSRIRSPLPVLPHRSFDHPFQGLLANQLQCVECGYKNPCRYDHFDSLSLTFPESLLVSLTLLTCHASV